LVADYASARTVAVALFIGGLLLWIRVMFFGVRRTHGDAVAHRAWPLGAAVALVTSGALLYARPMVSGTWIASLTLLGLVAGAAAWWATKRSASRASDDPDDDPRYKFQGHVARVTQTFTDGVGRIAFSYEGKRIELSAKWATESDVDESAASRLDDEVVIERIEGEIAYVERWATVEQRL
jgi:membrane protein implicated in regulation of membrane protease activity